MSRVDSIKPISNVSRVVLVLGMHRSGTSLVANILSSSGLALPSDLMPSHPLDNADGYFEPREMVSINNRLLANLGSSWKDIRRLPPGWAEGPTVAPYRAEIHRFLTSEMAGRPMLLLKDPRLCRLLPVWIESLSEIGTEIRIVRVVRRHDAVASSLARRAECSELRPAAIHDPHHSALLWLRYNVEAFIHARPCQQYVLAYEQLLEQPEHIIGALERLLGTAVAGGDLVRPTGASTAPKTLAGVDEDVSALLQESYRRLCGIGAPLDMNGLIDSVEHIDVAEGQALPATMGDTDQALYAAGILKHLSGILPHSPTGAVLSAPSGKQPWVFVTQDPTTRGTVFRVKHPVDALNRMGEPACWTAASQARPLLNRLGGIRTLIVHRCPWDSELELLFESVRQSGTPIGFDIDDLLLTSAVIDEHWFRYATDGDSRHLATWRLMIERLRFTALAADFLVVPTASLALAVEDLGKPVIIMPNGFSPENRMIGEYWRQHREADDSLSRIGYASGTPTHDRDFAEIVDPLAKVMRADPRIRLTLVGTLSDEVLAPLPAAQIERRGLVEHINLQSELCRFDLNLAPLEHNPFCDSKSPLKYFEAALVGVPSLVTDNPTYRQCIDDGCNGWLADTPGDWEDKLNEALQPGRCVEVGERARLSAIGQFDTDQLIEQLLQGINDVEQNR